jgi:mannan endo-1,4-beta-mannosidase
MPTDNPDDIRLYAVYSKELTVTLIDYEGTVKRTNALHPVLYNNEDTVTIPAQQYTYGSWEPIGWSTDDAAHGEVEIVSGEYSVNEDVTLYGLYRILVTVKYNTDNGGPQPPDDTVWRYTNSAAIGIYQNVPENVIMPTGVYKIGNTFYRWQRSVTGNKFAAAQPSPPVGIVTTMKALWTPDPVVQPVYDTEVVRNQATQDLLSWLNRPNPTPALGGHWGGVRTGWGPGSQPDFSEWEAQREILGKDQLVFSYEYLPAAYNKTATLGPPSLGTQQLSRADMKESIISKAAQGGIITVLNHMPNFVTYSSYDPEDYEQAVLNKGGSWDREGDVISEILPGGTRHEDYKQYLDEMAAYFQSLAVNGVPVPILYRPFHEMNGNWFWWGASQPYTENGETKKEVVKLWRFTWNYLTHDKGLRNLVWVWSVGITSPQDLEPYWPGSMYVDVVALDGYMDKVGTTLLDEPGGFTKTYRQLETIAAEEGLPIAIAEFGFNYNGRRETAVWQEKLPAFLVTRQIKPSYIAMWCGHSGVLGSPPPQPNTRDTNMSPKYLASKRFSKEELPVGSTIVIDPGYHYRPEGWVESGTAAHNKRPDPVSTGVEVSDAWWEDYEYRAFNISYWNYAEILPGQEDVVASHFHIYGPDGQPIEWRHTDRGFWSSNNCAYVGPAEKQAPFSTCKTHS